MSGALADLTFDAAVIEWRGPAPFFFAAVPDDFVEDLRYAARRASYGWGCVPVEAWLGEVAFTTSLFPRNGGYLVPLKAAVRRDAGAMPDAAVRIRLVVRAG